MFEDLLLSKVIAYFDRDLKIFSRKMLRFINQIRNSTKKTGSSKARQKTKPDGKRLGLKIYPNQPVKEGGIIVRQHGTKTHPGKNVGMGRDFTLYAQVNGFVQILKEGDRQYAHVVSSPDEQPT